MQQSVRIMAMRHASFYAPLIGVVAGGFLEAEGLQGEYFVRPPDRNPFEMLRDGEVEVMQSAVSSSWSRLEKGQTRLPVHFARINRRDGFWLLAREDTSFDWKALEGRVVLADHGPQPLAMLRWAAHLQGVDPDGIRWKNVGDPLAIVGAWRSGDGDFAHLQGPMPHVLAGEGLGRIVSSVGEAMPPVAFSTIAAMPAWLETPNARAFMRAWVRSLEWVHDSPADEITDRLAPLFEDVPGEALSASIADYQALGCWEKAPTIMRDEYERALDVFEWNKMITKRHPYDSVVADPWPFPEAR